MMSSGEGGIQTAACSKWNTAIRYSKVQYSITFQLQSPEAMNHGYLLAGLLTYSPCPVFPSALGGQ